MNSKNTIAISPGETIKEQLVYKSISQKEFALRMNVSEKHICNLLNGKILLTYEMSLKLESVLGIDASFWNELERRYREKLELVKYENDMENDIEKLSLFPYNEMQKLNWISKSNSKIEKVKNLRNFFEVSSLAHVESIYKSIATFRVAADANLKTISWVQKVCIEGRKKEVSKINLNKLRNSINEVKSFILKNPEEFSNLLVDVLAECGIALVYLPHLDGSMIHGVNFKQGNKIILGISVRGVYADKFWFTLFHEIGHILNVDNSENLADEFSSNTLINFNDYNNFIKMNVFTKESIERFSNVMNISCGIVVGRLQKDEYISFSKFNELREKYIIV